MGDPGLGAEKVTTGLALLLAQMAAKSQPQQETGTVCQPLAEIWGHRRESSHPLAPPWKQEPDDESVGLVKPNKSHLCPVTQLIYRLFFVVT